MPRLHRSRPPTSAQLAGCASVLPRVSPPTPSRCNPVAFGLKPRESVPHLGPQCQISYFNQDSANAEAPPFAPPTSARLAGSASVLPRVSPPTPSRCYPVAFGLKPRKSVPHLGPQCQISYINQDSANAEAPPFVPPTSAQVAGSASVLPRVSPPTPSRCNPVPLDLSLENPCRTWDPRAKFRILIKTRQMPRLHRSRLRPRPY